MHRLKRGFMMKCEKTAFCPGSCPTRRYLPSDCLFSRFLASEFRTKCLLLIITWRVPIRFEWRRWVHFYLNQETEIVITKKKSKSSHNIGARRSPKRVNWLKTEKIWFWSKMSDSQRFKIQVQIQEMLWVTLDDLFLTSWPLFLTENQRFEIIRLKV